MADHLAKTLTETFFVSSTPSDLIAKLRADDSLKLALNSFYLVLKRAVNPDGLDSLTDEQIHAIASLSLAIASATKSLSVEQTDPIIIAVVQLSVEFAVCFLERSVFRNDDLDVQTITLQLLEVSLTNCSDRMLDVEQHRSDVAIVDLLVMVAGDGGIDLDCHINCSPQGNVCPRAEKSVDQLLVTLAFDCTRPDGQASQMGGTTLNIDLNQLVAFHQHWAAFHVGCIHRLVFVCKELFGVSCVFDDKIPAAVSRKRLSVSLRIMKLLVNLAKEVSFVDYDVSMLQAFAQCADALPRLFRCEFEFVGSNTFVEVGIESIIVGLLEEFLQLVRVVFSSSGIFHNIQACVVASILDNWDCTIWSYNQSVVNVKPPLAYFPRCVMFILKLIQELNSQTYHTFHWEDFNTELECKVNLPTEIPSCHVRSEKVPLLKKFKVVELLKLSFPTSSHWVDNMLKLLWFLHSEGVKLKPKVERLNSNSARNSFTSEVENTACHEEEALFGDLFSEGGRSVGSADGYDQSTAALNSSSSYCNLPIQAATEMLCFFKSFVFSPQWLPSVFDDACKKLSRKHIDILLSILNSQGSFPEERASDSCAAFNEEKRTERIYELCYEVLHNILTFRALSDTLEDYLVEKILDFEGGSYMYNDQTLCLLAHTLFCRVGSSGSQLRKKLYEGVVCFITTKAKSIYPKCPSFKEFLATLPAPFHMEILLLAFHLSSDEEKVSLADLVLSSLKAIDAPAMEFDSTQLSCWALLVSRFILLLRHMIFYPRTCPPQLLTNVQHKLREAPVFASCLVNNLNDRLSSWASIVVKNLMGSWVGEEPVISVLINQLIDVVAFPASLYKDELAGKCLSLSWNDVVTTFSRIIGYWKGKKAGAVEDLIIERYIFLLCWDMPASVLTQDNLYPQQRDPQTPILSSMSQFMNFSHLLQGKLITIDSGIEFHDVVLAIIKHLLSSSLPVDAEMQSWDFLRDGLWMSLVLSVCGAGIWGYCMKTGISGVVPFWKGHASKDQMFFSSVEGLISRIIEAQQLPTLLNMFSSLLMKYLKAYQKAFISTLCNSEDGGSRPSALLILKHSEFDSCLKDDILTGSGASSSQLESVLELMSKVDVLVDKKSFGALAKIFTECMLHGFPYCLQMYSGILLSCILNIRALVYVLDGLMRINYAKEEFSIDTKTVHQILASVWTIKFDRIFQSVHGKCEAIFHSLCMEYDGPDFASLFVMKDLEGILRDINMLGESDDSGVYEWIISRAIGTMDSLRKAPQSSVFRFYLGADDVSEQVMRLYGPQRGNLLVLLGSLDNCHSDSVNVKVLNFFSDILSGGSSPYLLEKIQDKYLGMEILFLSKWLGKRLLGLVIEGSDGSSCCKASSQSLRESTINFFMCLVAFPDPKSRKLHDHLFEAALDSLDTAFLAFDTQTAKSYFQFVVQLSGGGETSMKLLLTKSVSLMKKLAGDEHLLSGLKLLFNFLRTLLSDCGSAKAAPAAFSGKSMACHNVGPDHKASTPAGSRKSSETLVLSSDQDGCSASIECDATSVDDDDDDGTSDGEVASVDKEEDDDANSERALASKVCTFTSSGSNFMEQHWYFCYTCDLTVSKGCCSVCAKVCHRGHRVVYSRLSRFFCDCGAGGVRGSSCQCLKPRKVTGSSSGPVRAVGSYHSILSFPDGDQLPDSDSDFEEEFSSDVDNPLRLSFPRELQDRMTSILEELDVEGQVLELCSTLLPCITSKRDPSLSKDKTIILGEDKVLSYGVDLLQLKKAYKSGSLDLKVKADYANSKELKLHLSRGSLVKSLLTVSLRGRLAVGEGDKVAIFDVGQLIGQATTVPVTADKTNVKPLSKNVVRFEIVHLVFNPMVENYLAVAGYEECQVLTVNARGEVTDRLAIELALQGAYVRRIDWVPGSQVQLMVVTNLFVKIYDLSQDNISPMHYFTLPDDMIVDATLVPSFGKMFLIVLSDNGSLFRLELSVEGRVEAKPMKEIIRFQDNSTHAKGSSLYFSYTFRLLFLTYQDGRTLIGRLSPDAASLTEISSVHEEQDGKLCPAALNRWKELQVGSGLFACFSSIKSNAAIAMSIRAHDLYAQNMRHSGGSSSPVVGITSYKALSKDKIHCLVLHEDGSLQIYLHVPVGGDSSASVISEKVKKLGSGILQSKDYASLKPEFPLDFFEKTVCITPDVKLGGDAVRNGDSEGAKQSLAAEDGYLEGPNPSGFKISVFNSNPDIVMVGLRVHVGNTSANHIPSELTLFQRVVKLDEGIRSWYDIPFTVAESLLADEEFTVLVGPTFNHSMLPRIDALEVYGREKDEFGWKEKMDAILDMEARVFGAKSLLAGSGKKRHSLQSASLQEQVISDGLRLLSRFYSLLRVQGCIRPEEVHGELSKLKCKQLIEAIFESDREPLLQAAACRILQSVFPKKEIYYQVKDTVRLWGVLWSTSVLSSRLGIGGAVGGWIIEEFTSQMRAVSKIALNRRSNLASFLETNGSEVVDGLMQLLWGIWELEQPDTQTINNIVVSSVELIYCYAECLALHGKETTRHSVGPAVEYFKKLIFSTNEAVQTSSSLAISSRLLQVPFPKQTMLAADDAAENLVPAAVPTAPFSGSSQIAVEEDNITSSVQYCCDGCSTVPILRRRWHCTVCPDFDLCEACYEVLDADHLPPPHSRDHLMTAIPIEVESLGDGNDIHFTTDETSDSGLMPSNADVGMQSSISSIHVLEANESEGFSVPVPDPVSISASKRAVNSLLLSELLEQLKGWMGTTTGTRAIPLMQLFYRLSSAVGGPFVDSSKPECTNLETLIKWFLDELNLNKPFAARTRSSFGEVSILVFMFFTLMLRNWHQPGNDASFSKASGTTETRERSLLQLPSSTLTVPQSSGQQEKNDFASQLIRACGTLRKQAFINYLMDILQQLVQIFKSTANIESSHGSCPGSGCGALLTVRRDVPSGNFSPFFSDSYAKAHRSDIFADYHRLLLENVFRLVYSLVRPEKHDKTGDKEKVYKNSSGKDLKLEGYQDVFCSYINNPNTTFVRRYARRLFLHLCGSKTHYYSVRDSWQYSTEMKKLRKHINKCGGFQMPAPYERSIKIVKSLLTMAEVAAARPRNWQKYCLRHGDVLPFLMNGIFSFGEESVIQSLKLLNLAFYCGKDTGNFSQKSEAVDTVTSSSKSCVQPLDTKRKKKADDGTESNLEKSHMDMGAAVDIFADSAGDVLRQFVDCFLLEWNSSSVRAEAKCVLYGVWHHSKQSFKETLLETILQKVRSLPMYGQNIIEYAELVMCLLGKAPDNGSTQQSFELMDLCATPDVIRNIYETLHSQNDLLANHPNSRIYNTLSSLVEFDGYYLESEPCVACSSPEVPYSRMKLESLKSETKFTDNRIIVKCTGSYTIQSVTMTVHDARKSKSVKVLNLYYNNRPVSDLSELKNNRSLWKRAKSCHLAFNQTELKVEFPIPITACNFMIELDAFYENLQALSLEPLQCPRCSRPVTDRHGICSNCHENAYQCRQCRNINYENLDSFLCNECGYSKYGRFEFNFMAKPSFTFDDMENDEDMKRGLAAIESESENAHRRYQQLLGFKKPLLKIVSSIGENETDSQQKDNVQQMMVSLPGPSCKINRKIALLGVLYGEKCKAAFDSVSKSVQTLHGLRQVLMNYLHIKNSDNVVAPSRLVVSRSPNNCYGCATIFVTQCLEILHVLSKHPASRKQLVASGILSELFENNIHQGPKSARVQARAVLCAFSEGDINAVTELNNLIQKKVIYCLEHHRSMDIAIATREELLLLSEVCSLADEFWESRLHVVFQLLFYSIRVGAKHPAISEHIILPCLRIISQACIPPKQEAVEKEQATGKYGLLQMKDNNSSKVSGSPSNSVNVTKPSESLDNNWDSSNKTTDIQLLSYSEWEKGASYLDFVRRQYKVRQAVKGGYQRPRPQRNDYLVLKYGLRWKRRACKAAKSDLSIFELGSWVTELVLSACSPSIRSEMCMLISLLGSQSSTRRFRLLNLLTGLLPATLSAGESAAEYFDLLFKLVESEDALVFLTARGCLATICKLIAQEVGNIESLERSLRIDISQGFILHKIIELLSKFLEVPNIRSRFMRDNLLSEVLEALIVIRGLVVQKTKLISDCNSLLKDLLDSLLLESSENKRQFIRACIRGLQAHGGEKRGRTCLFILEQLCNLICPSKPDPVYLLVLNKVHTQEEYIRGSMTKNPYSSSEIGPLMRDVKNKICHQLDLLGLLEDDYGMELLVAGNIISLDLSIGQVYEQVWKKSNCQSSNSLANSALLSSSSVSSSRDCPPMVVTYRLQGLDGEATEPMIKELEEDREESQDPEVEFAIASAVREYGGLEIIMEMIKRLRNDFKSNREQLMAVLNLFMHCCKIRENRRASLRLGALGLLLETTRCAFSVDAMESAEGILLIVESLTIEANESDNISITQSALTVSSDESGTGEQAKKIVLMFLEKLSHPQALKKSNKQQRNTEMVARILPYLTYGEPAAMEALIQHFNPYLQDWGNFDRMQKQHEDSPKDESIAQQAAQQRFTLENFVRVSESLKTSSCGGRLKDIIIEKGITGAAVIHLKESFAVVEKAGFKSSAEWALGLRLPSVPLILSMLRGLSTGHLLTQRLIEEAGILPLLHALEGVAGENEIGARAENLLDTLSDKEGKGYGFLGEKICELRHATRDEKRRQALRKREELLKGLGMWQELASDGGERIVVSQPKLEGFDDVEEEEDGLACMVCREGYKLRPADLLGVYSFSKRVNLGAGTSGSVRGDCVYTTVSYFNIIHFQCHQEAKRADAALKNPKKEWEGATLRNNESLCNSLFPVRGPSVPLPQYIRYVDQHWDNLNALGRADGSRLRLLTYDIVLMLARFATGASFSAESRGGGRESNSRFLPFMIQMARHLIDQGSSSHRRSMTKAITTYLASSTADARPSPPGTQSSMGAEESVQFMMVNSLLAESYDTWLQHRRAFLQRGICHAYMQHSHSHSTARSSPGSQFGSSSQTPTTETVGNSELLSITRPMLVYTGLVEQLQRFLKVKRLTDAKAEGSSKGLDAGDESIEIWEIIMKERLLDVKEMVGFSKELVSLIDEMNSACDLQEAFDIIGVLGDVLSGGTNDCEEFVRAAIDAGKS